MEVADAPPSDPGFYDPCRDGVTYSMLQGWLNCRESCRLSLQGWTSKQASFSQTFGGASHWMLQHVYDDVRNKRLKTFPGPKYVARRLAELEKIWKTENPIATEKQLQDMEFVYGVLSALMPMYFKHWYKDITELKWERVESEFRIPLIVVRNGRSYQTFLRGKMDGAFRDRKNRRALFETKTKSRMDEGNLVDILPFEMQINTYVSALWHLDGKAPRKVLYNVIRRPGLRQKQSESIGEFIDRITEDIKLRPDWYFVRMEMNIDEAEVERFKLELGDLIGDFLDWWHGHVGHYRNSGYCENKYGTCWALSICSRGDYGAVFKRDKVFRELEDL